MRLDFEIPGEPFALQRGKAVRWGDRIGVRDPPANVSWKGSAAVWMLKARTEAGITSPFPGPVELKITAYSGLPVSQEKKRVPVPEHWWVGKKDADNIAKAVGDAGNGVLWLDDRQVVRLVVTKLVAAQGLPARMQITVEELP